MSINSVFKVVAVLLPPPIKKQTTLSIALAQLALAIFLGLIALVGLLFLFSISVQNTNAAPPAKPLTAIFTNAFSIAHTAATTHQMRVFADGTISNQFLNENGQNQIDQDNIGATTIALLFDQHPSDTLDVGLRPGDFTPSTPITLDTASTIPGYAEDTSVVYASKVLSYQITQSTLATTANNCVEMDLSVRNTYTDATSLTGGKLLFMVDIDVALAPAGDLGQYDATKRLAYLTDYNEASGGYGYSMGVSLLQGDFRGYGIVDQLDPGFPSTEPALINELITPTNAIINGDEVNNVVWLIVNIPDLAPGQEELLAFGLCANTVAGGPAAEDEAAGKLEETFNKLANLSVLKTSTPPPGTAVIAGQPITYTITISNTGQRYVSNIVVTDTLPTSTNLITYSTSQGSIIANNGTVTATVGQLYPASNTVTITLVASTSILATDGQILSNRAFVNSQPIITQTNVVTHQIINRPILALTKQAGEIWQKRVKLVFTNTTVAENLTDFPVLVTLNSGRIDYALTQNAGQDIRFVDPDGKLLSHEIENWDENGTSSVWVKIPQIDALSNADYVWLYYDNPFASDGQNPADVWSSNYRGVWHLNNNVLDSALANNGTGQGLISDTGQIAYSQNFAGSGSYIDTGSNTSLDELFSGTGGTVSAWIKPAGWGAGGYGRIVDKSNDIFAQTGWGFELDGTPETLRFERGFSTRGVWRVIPNQSIKLNQWQYVAVTYNETLTPTEPVIYINGIAQTLITESSPFGTPTPDGDTPLWLGNISTYLNVDRSFDGTLDEVRIVKDFKTPGWILSQYTSMTDAFISYQTEETTDTQIGGTIGAPFTYTLTVTNSGNKNATNVVINDTLPTNANYVSGGSRSGNVISWTIPTVEVDGSQDVTFVVSTCQMSLLNSIYNIVSNDQGVSLVSGTPLLSVLDPPTINTSFQHAPLEISVGGTVNFTDTTATNGGPIVSQSWNFGDGNFATGTLTSHTYPNPGIYTATLTVTDACGYTGTVTNTVTVYAPILNITKSATPQPVMAGERLTYTIVVSNSGQTTATNAVISDTLPANTTFVENSIQLNPSGAGTKGTQPPTLITNATLTPGQTITVTFAVTVNNGLPVNTIITNTATVTSGQTPTPTTHTITSTTTGFDLAINKFSSPLSAVPGETITYTVTVSNLETTPVTGAVVSDTLPPEIEDPTWGCTGTNGAVCASPTGSGNLGETVNMPPGGQLTYVITGQLVASATGTIVNQASVTIPFGAELNPANNVATNTNTVAPKADLSISKYDTPDPVSAGASITYTLHITNNGPSQATGLTVLDPLPAGFILGSAGGTGWNCDNVGAIITCTKSSLSVGDVSLITITATTPVTGGIYTNMAVVSAATPDPDIFNNIASITTTVVARFDLAISKSVTPNTSLLPGQPLTYTLVYTNLGPNIAKNVIITDTIPAILTNVTFDSSGASITPVGSNTYVWRVNGNLAPGAGGTITVSGIVSPQLETDTVFANTATINADLSSTNIETGPAPNSSTVTSTVSLPRLSINKQSSAATVSPGQRITYTITVSNSGLANATGAIIRDNLPDNTTYVPGSVQLDPPGLGTTGTPPLLVSNLTIPAGQQVTATFAVTVSRPLTDGTLIANTASVTAAQNLTPLNDTITTIVVAPPAVEIAKTGLAQVNFGDTAVFTFTVTNAGDSLLQITDVVDDYAAPVTWVGGDTNGNGWLDLNESWVYIAPYTIQLNDPTPLVNTAHVTAVDGIGTETSSSDTHSTTITFAPVITITKDGPLTANVGDTLIFTFTIEHASGSDGSPVHDVLVADDYAGLATLVSNGNGDNLLDFGEQWVYTATYTIKPTNPNPLINTGTVIGKDRENEVVSATATHSTALAGFAPVLFVDKQGPTQASIGETVEYTFIVINYANINTLALFGLDFLGVLNIDPGDGSPINMSVVTDTVAGAASYVSGDYNGNNKLDGGEGWIYTATHTITVTDPDPLINMVFANGTDQEGDEVMALDTHNTNILHAPQIQVSRTGPVSATVGQSVNFTFTLKHSPDSDNTPVRNLTVTDSKAGTALRIGGDTNINNQLDYTETWTYTASYTIKLIDPDPLVSMVTAQGIDEDSDPVSVTTPFSLTITDAGGERYYLPIIFNNGG